MQEAAQSSNSQSIVAAVKALMNRKKVPARQQGKKLGEILNLSYSQGHRKLKTDTGWTIAQLQAVAEYFGESLATLGLVEVSAVSDGHPVGMLADGLFVVEGGQHEYPCVLWVGEQIHAMRRLGFIAYQEAGQWRVVETLHCPVGVACYKINKLEIVLKARAIDVAIVSDDRAAADSLRSFLAESGFDATLFHNATALERALHEGKTFDGYIIDWLLGHRTTEGLISHVRLSPGAAVPIFVLTEDVSSGPADQDELARVILKFNVQVREKPVRLRTFTAEIQKALGA